MKTRYKTRKDICDILVSQWERFNEELFENSSMNTNEFQKLFKDTWEYFYTAEQDNEKMCRYDAKLLSQMTPMLHINIYPDNIDVNQFQAATRFVSEFIFNLISPQNYYNSYNFWEGWIAIRPYCDSPDRYVNINDFEVEFNKLCEEYYEEDII